jgi:methylase of polypeptide subunit release factors
MPSRAPSNGVEVYRGDLFAPLPLDLEGRVDVIVSVVPYVPDVDAIDLLPRDTLQFESTLSYDGGDRGSSTSCVASSARGRRCSYDPKARSSSNSAAKQAEATRRTDVRETRLRRRRGTSSMDDGDVRGHRGHAQGMTKPASLGAAGGLIENVAEWGW